MEIETIRRKLELEYYLAKICCSRYKLIEYQNTETKQFEGWILQIGHEIDSPGRGILISYNRELKQIREQINKYYQQIFGTKFIDND